MYGFNPLTPMDLISLPIDESVSLDGNSKSQVVKTLHESLRQQIEKRNCVYATKANKGANMLSFSSTIGFGCICARRDFQPIGNRSYNHEEIGHFRSLRGSMTMLIKLICQVSIMLVLPLMFLILLCLMIRDQILLKREEMMRISPTPSVIMPTTHWRCQLG